MLDNAGDIVMELAWNSIEEQFDKSYQGLMTGLLKRAVMVSQPLETVAFIGGVAGMKYGKRQSAMGI